MATLRVGTLDLSSYLDVQPGAGMDPAAPSFSDRVFSHSLLKEGGVLALTDLKEKEMIFPLFLKAATKDLLNGLVRQINYALDIAGQTVTFQDDGSSQATTFDLISGQLDIEYDLRRAQNNYLHAKLRLFTQPLGYTGTRLVATGAATAPLLILTIPSVAGDQPAQVVAQISGASDGQGYGSASAPLYVALSVLPGSTYRAIFGASDIYAGGGGYVSVTSVPSQLAYNDLAARFILSGTNIGIPAGPAATVPVAYYPGRNRVLMIARPVYPSGARAVMPTLPILMTDTFNNAYPTVAFPANQPTAWGLYDLGVFNLPTVAFPTTPHIAVILPFLAPSVVASQGIDITALMVVPDDQTVFISDRAPNQGFPAGASYVLDDTLQILKRNDLKSNPPQQLDMAPYARGNIPRIGPGAPAYLAAIRFRGMANDLVSVSLSVRERVRYLF